jgi:HD-GYP domain-containing protein (c-di-GMP phosphodiesterase class II)
VTSANAFNTANPHALACILEAAETRSIISANDIFDVQGIKLWAAHQPVSAELQRKLADRRLRQPLETSLVAEDGVKTATLCEALGALVDGGSAFAPMLKPHAARLQREAAQLQVQPAAQLLLTASQAARPAAFDHATTAMAVNGALCAAAGADTPEIRSAMLAGLLHDLGEMYIAPQFGEADADREMDFLSYQQLVVHPHIGFLILKQLTAYPGSVAQAVAEHHERLDGSGYPRALRERDISPQGRLLSVTEATLNAMRDPSSPLLHASVALRAVPGEFDPGWVGKVSNAANAQPPSESVMEPADIQARLGALDALLSATARQAAELSKQPAPAAMKAALEVAGFLIGRVRTGWNESGLWSPQVTGTVNAAEVEAIEDELYRRLRGVQRATLMRAGALAPEHAARLTQFCDGLAMQGG